uniref:At1g61320/AtMIF1 LRR domain-containing protein n=1 Tax=Triticum urartu TaxID=4572 RepID=A0A8R7QHD3_TRIUA
MQRDTLVVPGKFLHLQCLCIGAFNPDYDYLSLVSFLDACPSLETFILSVDADRVRQESVLAESSHDLRQMPGHVHRNIKDVFIIGFCSAKSMVELTCHMLENAKSLEYLTLNTSSNPEISCSDSENGRCLPMSKHMRKEARKALLAVERYILGKVPCSVELEVVKPCSRCNTLEI